MHYVQDAVNQLSSLCIKGNEYLTNVGVVLINLFEWVWFINSCYLYSDEDKLASSVAIPEVSPPGGSSPIIYRCSRSWNGCTP